MMKMEIALDEAKVKSDNIYDLADMWRIIDEKFIRACTKEVQLDGSVMYSGMYGKDYFTDLALAHIILSRTEWFANYCIKWIWYDNDDDESLPFQDINLITIEKKDNPLFNR